ncbi:MAG: putative porin, partial [Saprospiraceae bacterium]|nr:putative porin [Saprospiraceae bacterium]
LSLTWLGAHVDAQITPPGGAIPPQAARGALNADSTVVFVRAADLYDVDTLDPGSLDASTHQYHPARSQRFDYAHLGNLGSAHRRQYFDLIESKGLDIGLHQYDLYRRTFADFRFYQAPVALTEFNYSQGVDQLDGILDARFGRSFAKGVNASVDYLRINQEGAFAHQRAKHTAFGFGIWYDAPDGRYDGLYHYGSNSIVQEDNGGIVSYDDLRFQQLVANVPVNLTDPLTVNRERAFSMQHSLHLIPAVDSLPRRTLIDLIHTGQYKSGFVRYTDESIGSDIDYYSVFALDDRGVRHFIDWQTIDNQFDLLFRFRVQPDRSQYHELKAGIQYRHTSLGQEPLDRGVNETFLNATGRLWLTRTLALEGQGYLALTGQSGDFSLEGKLAYQPAGGGALTAGLLLYSRSPWVIEDRLYVTQLPAWDHTLNDYTHVRLRVGGDLPGIDLQFGGAIHLMDNRVY